MQNFLNTKSKYFILNRSAGARRRRSKRRDEHEPNRHPYFPSNFEPKKPIVSRVSRMFGIIKPTKIDHDDYRVLYTTNSASSDQTISSSTFRFHSLTILFISILIC